jgi:hypothetical protein
VPVTQAAGESGMLRPDGLVDRDEQKVIAVGVRFDQVNWHDTALKAATGY